MRFRLFVVLRDLGVRREVIHARIQEKAQEQQARFDAEAIRWIEANRRVDAMEARRLRESEAYSRMNEDQKAAWRLEDTIVEWING